MKLYAVHLDELIFSNLTRKIFRKEDFTFVDNKVVVIAVFTPPAQNSMEEMKIVYDRLCADYNELAYRPPIKILQQALLKLYAEEHKLPLDLDFDKIKEIYISKTIEKLQSAWDADLILAKQQLFGRELALQFALSESLDEAKEIFSRACLGRGTITPLFDALTTTDVNVRHVVEKAVMLTAVFSPNRKRFNKIWDRWNTTLSFSEWLRIFPEDKKITKSGDHTIHQLLRFRFGVRTDEMLMLDHLVNDLVVERRDGKLLQEQLRVTQEQLRVAQEQHREMLRKLAEERRENDELREQLRLATETISKIKNLVNV